MSTVGVSNIQTHKRTHTIEEQINNKKQAQVRKEQADTEIYIIPDLS